MKCSLVGKQSLLLLHIQSSVFQLLPAQITVSDMATALQSRQMFLFYLATVQSKLHLISTPWSFFPELLGGLLSFQRTLNGLFMLFPIVSPVDLGELLLFTDRMVKDTFLFIINL